MLLCIEYSSIISKNLHCISSTVQTCQLRMSARCSEFPPDAATYDHSSRNDKIALSMNSCGISFNKLSTEQSFPSEMCANLLARISDNISALLPTHDNALVYPFGASAVIFLHHNPSLITRSLRQILHLTSDSCHF